MRKSSSVVHQDKWMERGENRRSKKLHITTGVLEHTEKQREPMAETFLEKNSAQLQFEDLY